MFLNFFKRHLGYTAVYPDVPVQRCFISIGAGFFHFIAIAKELSTLTFTMRPSVPAPGVAI